MGQRSPLAPGLEQLQHRDRARAELHIALAPTGSDPLDDHRAQICIQSVTATMRKVQDDMRIDLWTSVQAEWGGRPGPFFRPRGFKSLFAAFVREYVRHIVYSNLARL
jgi:hypothetical protein